MNELTDKQKNFVDEYLIDFNIMQASIRAGYSEKYAKANSYRLLDNEGIKKEIDFRKKIKTEYLHQRFAFDAEVARDVMYELLKNKGTPDAVRLSAAKDFMDRAGFKPVDKQETTLNGGLDINKQSELIGKYLHE